MLYVWLNQKCEGYPTKSLPSFKLTETNRSFHTKNHSFIFFSFNWPSPTILLKFCWELTRECMCCPLTRQMASFMLIIPFFFFLVFAKLLYWIKPIEFHFLTIEMKFSCFYQLLERILDFFFSGFVVWSPNIIRKMLLIMLGLY